MDIYYDYIAHIRIQPTTEYVSYFHSIIALFLFLLSPPSLLLSLSGLQPPPNVCNLCFKMLPSLAALETHLQNEHAKEVAMPPSRNHSHNDTGSPYGAKVSSNLTFCTS